MKKLVSILIVVMLLLTVFSGCEKQEVSEGNEAVAATTSEDGETELTSVRCGVLSLYLSSMVNYIIENKMDEAVGIKLELSVFSNGAGINEALGAGSIDVATTGSAMIFSAANYGAKIIGNHVIGTAGNAIYVRSDSEILSVKGYNSEFPEVYGSPDTVRGLSIIINAGTTSQMTAIKWLSALGLTSEDVELITMDFSTGAQAFAAGEGDVLVVVPPYDMQAEAEGFTCVASLETLNSFLYEGLIVSDEYYESNPEIIQKFVDLIYAANDILQADMDLKTENLIEWYTKNGIETTEEDARAECETKPFITTEDLKTLDFGVNEENLAEFYAGIESLTADQVELVKANTIDDFIKKYF